MLQRFFPLFLLLCLFCSPAQAAAVKAGHVSARLIADHESVIPGQVFEGAIVLEHDADWHTYWKQSETGYPINLQWHLPEGWRAEAQEWPTPERYATEYSVDYVLTGQSLLLFTFYVPEDAVEGDYTLNVTADWLMCKDACIPSGEVELSRDIHVGKTAKASPEKTELQGGYNAQPADNAHWQAHGLKEGNRWRLRVVPEGTPPHPGTLYFFSEDGSIAPEAAQEQNTLADGSIELLLHTVEGLETGTSLRGVLRAEKGWNADGSQPGLLIDLSSETPARAFPLRELLPMLGWALLGGMILNLMPCVFPVLGIKVMSFVSQAGEDRGKIKRHGLVFALGVLISFWVLVSILIGLKAAGQKLGWGFQLQYPGTTYLMAAFILLFGLNMSGLFEIGQSAVGVGGKLQQKKGYSGSFFSGVLATVVATPCSAPFLGTALGYAMTQPPAAMLLIFTCVALGLSSPYLLLSFYPALLGKLPRPGAWMESFKQGMAFLLYATVAYLIWVLAAQISAEHLYGTYALLNVFLALIGLAMSAWIYGRWAAFGKPRKTRIIAIATAAILAIAALANGFPKAKGTATEDTPAAEDSGTPQAAVRTGSNEVHWEHWAPGKAKQLAAEGHTVWVDFTARWCVTCQTNKATVFGSEEVLRRFREEQIIALKADWTNRDPLITEALQQMNKAAVPVNLLYRPNQPVQELPTILTPGIVLKALDRE